MFRVYFVCVCFRMLNFVVYNIFKVNIHDTTIVLLMDSSHSLLPIYIGHLRRNHNILCPDHRGRYEWYQYNRVVKYE